MGERAAAAAADEALAFGSSSDGRRADGATADLTDSRHKQNGGGGRSAAGDAPATTAFDGDDGGGSGGRLALDGPQLDALRSRIGEARVRLLGLGVIALGDSDGAGVRDLVAQVADVLKKDRAFIENYIARVSSIREALQSLTAGVIGKLSEGSLLLQQRVPTKGDSAEVGGNGCTNEELEARAKAINSDVARLQALVAKVTAELAQAAADAADLQKQAAVAAEAAAVAENEATKAQVAAEAAIEAVRAKALEDAELLRKKQQEAAERARRAQEEEAERRRLQAQAALASNGQGRDEANARGQEKWPRYVYNCEANDFDSGIACILRTYPGVMGRDDVVVEQVQQLHSGLKLVDNEELVSNVIRVRQASKNANFKFPEPAVICIPHCAPRHGTTREPVVRALVGTEWIDLETKDAPLDDVKDVRLVEARCRPQLCFTYAVVHRLKKEQLTLIRKGGKLTSAVDNRITISWRPAAVRSSVPLSLQVQAVDQASVAEVKHRYADQCDCLVSASPVLTLALGGGAPATSRVLAKPATFTLPIPAPAKAKRPPSATAAATGASDSEKRTPAPRPHTAASFAFGGPKAPAAVAEEKLNVLVLSSDDRWVSLEDCELVQNKKGDLVTVELKELPRRMWLLRTKSDATASHVERAAAVAWAFFGKRLARFVVRQKAEDPTDLAVACASTSGGKLERLLRRLEEDGYTEGPQQPTAELVLAEGQRVDVGFRGNVQCDEADVRLHFAYNTQLPARLATYVCEADKYAQKGFDAYRGFVQFFGADEECAPRPAKDAGDGGAAAADAADRRKDKKAAVPSAATAATAGAPGAATSAPASATTVAATPSSSNAAAPAQAAVAQAPQNQQAVARQQQERRGSAGEQTMLAELLICLPKQTEAPDTPKASLHRAPVKFSSEGPIDEEFLRSLAADLGDEWKALAPELGIKRMRVQAIMRNNSKTDNEQIIYDVLVTWAKRVPRSVNKVDVLCDALLAVGRADLAEDVRDREEDHRLQRADVTRESQLKRAFARTVRSDDALAKWRDLAQQLGLTEDDISDIETKMAATDGGGTLHERLLLCLTRWKDTSGHRASVVALARALKACGVNDAAVDVFRLRRRLH